MVKKKGPVLTNAAKAVVEKLVTYITSNIEGAMDCGIDMWCEHCIDQFPNYTEDEQAIVQEEFIDIYEAIINHPQIQYYT